MSDPALIGAPGTNQFNIIKSGKTTLNISGLGTTVFTTVPHNLGFAPTFLVYALSGTAPNQACNMLPYFTGFGTSGSDVGFNNWIYAQTDKTNLFITAIIVGAEGGLTEFVYYLFDERTA